MVQGFRFFYNQVLILFRKKTSVMSIKKVTDINELENHAYTETDSYTCDTIFNSIYDKESRKSN
jgi:lycopene beta-cyclase